MDPLFNGTLHFVQMVFVIQNQQNRQVSIDDADMATALQYAQKAIRPISLYASQYGYNHLVVSPTILPAKVVIPDTTFNDGSLKDWVHTIAADNVIPNGDCIVILFPSGLTNTSWDAGTKGEHYFGALPYMLCHVAAQGLTVQDVNWDYAGGLSHEIAEMTVNSSGNNPEVCDPCGPNYNSTYIDYFDVKGNYIKTTQTPPYQVDFAFDFYINGIVMPSQSAPEKAPAWACAYAPPLPSGKQITIGQNADGRLEVFYTTLKDEMYHLWQVAPNANWQSPAPIGKNDFALQLAVTENANQELVLVYRGTNNDLYYNWQTAANGNWKGETSVGNNEACLQVVAAVFSNGQLGIFYVGTNSKLYYNWQTGVSSWKGEMLFGDSARQLTLAQNQDKSLEVFYIGLDGMVYHNRQTGSNDQWSGPQQLGGPAVQVVAGQNKDGRLEIFFIGTDQQIYHNWQVPPLNPAAAWNGAVLLGGIASQLAIASNQDKRLELFYIGKDNLLYHRWQLTPGGNWSGEAYLVGAAKQLAVGNNKDGRLELFYIGTNDAIYHNWQTTPNGIWNGEVSL
jgi:hypothetical protein